MPIQKPKLMAIGSALVGVLMLVAAVLPAIKGGPVNLVYLCIGVFWLILSLVARRKARGGGPA
jgi:hypothetical protein